MKAEGSHYKSGGKVKKMANGGSSGDDLQDLLPSGKKIGAVLNNKLDPEIAYAAANPVGAISRRIVKAAKNTEVPKSYETEQNIAAIQKAGEMGGMGHKKGGRIAKKVGTVKKYKTGGKVKKYAEGGDIVTEAQNAIRSGKNLDPGMSITPKPRTMNIDGKDVELKAIPMPNLDRGEGINIPGYGRAKTAPMQARGNLQPLKTGGKVKRGNKK